MHKILARLKILRRRFALRLILRDRKINVYDFSKP